MFGNKSNKGRHFSEETRKKMSESHKGNKNSFYGKHHSEENKRKIGNGNKGKVHSKESKIKVSITIKNRHYSFWKGKKFSDGTKLKMSKSRKKEKNSNWKGGITSQNNLLRSGKEIRIWRISIFERNNFVCQCCNKKYTNLAAHHISNFADFPELRFNIDNGITLCKQCHISFHTKYGKKYNTKEQLKEFMNNFKIHSEDQKTQNE